MDRTGNVKKDKNLSAMQRYREFVKETKTGERIQKGPIDLPFLLLTILIMCFGLVMVYSASYASAYYEEGNSSYFFFRQLVFAALGIALMLFVSGWDYRIFRRFSIPMLAVSVFLLLAVLVIGVESNGAKRWINLGFTTFQPSEVAKISVILAFSAMIATFKDKMQTFKYGILPFGIILVVIAGLMILEPHLSGTVVILLVGAAMMFMGGAKWYWFVGGIAFVAVAGIIAIQIFPYAQARIDAWLDPFTDMSGDGWQIVQSLYAIGSGGVMGLGLGKSRQKFLYLPEEHNDFVFAVVCEELGFVGAVIVLLLFAMLIIRGYWLALHARDRFCSLAIAGITTLLAVQVIFNVAVVTGVVPVTGIALPFFSYGGTALVLQLVEMGIVMSLARQNPVSKAG